MKAPAIIISVVFAVGIAFVAGHRAGQYAMKHRGIYLSEASQARGEICATLAVRVFKVSDDVRAARLAGKSIRDVNSILPNRNWIYEPDEHGFRLYWKLSYDDTFWYDSTSDVVRGENDFDSITKRNEE